jgi:hypothetical protein
MKLAVIDNLFQTDRCQLIRHRGKVIGEVYTLPSREERSKKPHDKIQRLRRAGRTR